MTAFNAVKRASPDTNLFSMQDLENLLSRDISTIVYGFFSFCS